MCATFEIREKAVFKELKQTCVCPQIDHLGDSKNVAQDITRINEYMKKETRDLTH